MVGNLPEHNPKYEKAKKLKQKKKQKEKKKQSKPQRLDDIRFWRVKAAVYDIKASLGKIKAKHVVIAVSVILLALLGYIVWAVLSDLSNPAQIGEYDEVRLEYEIYSEQHYEEKKDPEISELNEWVDMCHRYDNKCSSDDPLIKGFYDGLLGLRTGDVIEFKSIPKCKDLDDDGIDDVSGKEALSYGYEDDELYNTDIVIWARVREVRKSSSSEASVLVFFILPLTGLIPKSCVYLNKGF